MGKPIKKKYNVIEKIRKYDQGELDEAQVIELFQYLIDSETIWSLQENYGRVAKSLIEAGHCRKAFRNSLLHL
jgi:hypothetical protein